MLSGGLLILGFLIIKKIKKLINPHTTDSRGNNLRRGRAERKTRMMQNLKSLSPL